MTEYLPPVSQVFDAEIDKYIAKLEAMKKAQKDFADQSAKTSTSVDKDTSKTGTAFDDLAAKAKKSGRDIDDSLKSSGKASSDFDRLVTSNLKDGEKAFDSLQRTIVDTKTKLVDLRKGFASTGNQSYFGDIKQSESDLKKLESFAEDMVPNFGKAGHDSGKAMSQGIMSSLSDAFSGGVSTAPVIAGLAIGLAAPLSALVAGAVSTGLTLGFVGLGAYALRNNSGISGALAELKSDVSSVFAGAAQPLLQPLIAGIKELDGVAKSVKPELTALFAAAAPAVDELVHGLGGLVASALPSFVSAIKDAQPIIAHLAADLPELGASLGHFFDDLAKSPGAVMAIDDTFTALDLTLTGVGKTIEYLSDAFNFVYTYIVPVRQLGLTVAALGSMIGLVKKPATDFKDLFSGMASTELPAFTNGIADSSYGLAAYTAAIDDSIKETLLWITAQDQAADANLNMHESYTSLVKALKGSKTSWDITTAAGQKTIEKFDAAKDAMDNFYTSQLKTTDSSPKTVKAYLAQAQALYKIATADGAPKSVLSALKSEISGLKSELEKLTSKTWRVKVTTTYRTIGTGPDQPALAKGGVVHAAQGLVSGILAPTSPGTLVLAGERETGGEVFLPLRGISSQRAMNLASVAGDAYGFDVTPKASRSAPAVAANMGNYTHPATSGAGGDIHIYLGGKEMAVVHAALIGPSQRYKIRTGATGLS